MTELQVEKEKGQQSTGAARPVGAERPKKPTAAQRAKRAAVVHQWTRFGVQLAFFVLAPGLFSGAFNGVKYVFTQIGLAAPLEATSFVVLLVAVLAFTVLFGRFFCGYACAFGSLGDWLYSAFEFLRAKTPIPRISFPPALVKALSLLKYVILTAVCLACFCGVWANVSGYSPWVAFAAFTAGSLEGVNAVAYALLALVVVGMIVRERFFCQFLCPMGAVFSLLPVFGFSEFTRRPEHCARKCGRCQAACPVDIWPDADGLAHGECLSCGRCADACPMANVNLVALEKPAAKRDRLDLEGTADGEGDVARPVRKTKDKWLLLRGTGAPAVLAKALMLLVLCWITGATRYLPPFGG